MRHSSGRPRMCIRIAPHLSSAMVFAIFASQRNALTSLTISAPASTAARATAALYVSIEMVADGRFAFSARMTGITRSSSIASVTLCFRAGPCRFAANVEQVGAIIEQLQPMLNGFFGIEIKAAVRKGIRRDVHHAHQQRALAERDHAGPEIPFEDGTHGGDSKSPQMRKFRAETPRR